MRFGACVAMILVGLTGGCSLLGKKKPDAAPVARGPADAGWPETPRSPDTGSQAIPTSARNGLLAGRVVDTFQRHQPAAFIQVVSAQDAGAARGAPIEVAADQNGYFMIQGLQSGQPYELIARAKDGERLLAGRVWVRPPDPKVLIRISEDFVTGTTPPVPPPPGVQGQRPQAAPGASAPADGAQSALPSDHGWAPGRGLTTDGRRSAPAAGIPGRGAELGAPLRLDASDTPPRGMATPAPRADAEAYPPNLTTIPPQVVRNPEPPKSAEPPRPAGAPVTPVPSCTLLGDRLHNLALRDLRGDIWEFRQRQGKLVLLDFWYTECVPCQHAIDHLRILQMKYGPQLEVVGVACESGTPAQQLDKVKRVAARKQINYRLLMGNGRDVPCPAREQFQVRVYPTLFLLDRTGRIVKRWEGLDEAGLRDLETLLQHHLTVAH